MPSKQTTARHASELHTVSIETRDSRRAALNLMEDAVRARQLMEALNAGLRESEQRYRTLFDLGPVAVYACDVPGVIQNFNRRAAELWGREPAPGDTDERFCGSYKLFRPDGIFMPHEQCPMAEVLSGKIGQVRDAEVLIERPDGSRVTVVVNIRPLKNQRGEVTGAINCFYDITERKQTEEALRSHAEEVSRFNRAAVGRESRMIELKQEINELRSRQGEAARYLLELEQQTKPAEPEPSTAPAGVPGDGLVPLDAILCTEELDARPARLPDYETENRALAALIQALAESPRTILQTLAEKVLEVVQADSSGLSLLTKDQQSFHWAAIAGAWQPHLGGSTPRNFGPCGDVLDCNAPLLFRHWERRYPYLQAATPLAEEGLLVPFYVNAKAVGTIWAITHDERRKFDAEDLRQLENLGRFASAAYQATEFQQVQESRRAALNLMEDAVQSRDKLSEADRRKNEFIGMLAHELRNPLAPLSSALDVIKQAGSDPKAIPSLLPMMERQIHVMSRLIDDLLDASRITHGKVRLRREAAELGAILNRSAAMIRHQTDARRQRLEMSLPEAPIPLSADPTRLEQVFHNLLSNASKFGSPGGHIWLSAELAEPAAPQSAGEVVVRVRDDGSGIAPDLLPRVFDLFSQGDSSLERSLGGLGIGLALVRSLVELHGGRVQADSPGVGQGSEFRVVLPVGEASATGATAATAAGREAGAGEGERGEENQAAPVRRRVLVVDDNRDAAQMLAMLLRRAGHEVQTAYDGHEALETAQAFAPQVVVLDIGLPGIDGYEAARRLRQRPELAKTRLIAVSGYGHERDRTLAREAGFDHFLVKPVQAEVLKRLLASP